MRLAVFTHVIHKKYKGEYYAYSPYVREINLWIKDAMEVEVFAPLVENDIPNKNLKYIHQNLNFRPIPALDLLSLRSIFRAGLLFPIIFLKVLSGMHRTDHIHIRCPGNIGLIACLAQMFFPKKTKSVKYAGNWDPDSNQPWSYNLQKWILKNKFLSRNVNVLVYGKWGGSTSRNIQPFFTASFSEKDKLDITKDFSPPFKFMFVGNLVKGKGIFQCIDLVENIRNMGFPCSLKIFGDGILKQELQEYIHQKGLSGVVTLMGRRDIKDLQIAYKDTHFVILLSRSEGWPKALAEGMWYGAVPISTKVSCIPWMLGEGERGVLLSNRNSEIDLNNKKIKYLLQHPAILEEMSRSSMKWAQNFTLEKFERDIKKYQ